MRSNNLRLQNGRIAVERGGGDVHLEELADVPVAPFEDGDLVRPQNVNGRNVSGVRV